MRVHARNAPATPASLSSRPYILAEPGRRRRVFCYFQGYGFVWLTKKALLLLLLAAGLAWARTDPDPLAALLSCRKRPACGLSSWHRAFMQALYATGAFSRMLRLAVASTCWRTWPLSRRRVLAA